MENSYSWWLSELYCSTKLLLVNYIKLVYKVHSKKDFNPSFFMKERSIMWQLKIIGKSAKKTNTRQFLTSSASSVHKDMCKISVRYLKNWRTSSRIYRYSVPLALGFPYDIVAPNIYTYIHACTQRFHANLYIKSLNTFHIQHCAFWCLQGFPGA